VTGHPRPGAAQTRNPSIGVPCARVVGNRRPRHRGAARGAQRSRRAAWRQDWPRCCRAMRQGTPLYDDLDRRGLVQGDSARQRPDTAMPGMRALDPRHARQGSRTDRRRSTHRHDAPGHPPTVIDRTTGQRPRSQSDPGVTGRAPVRNGRGKPCHLQQVRIPCGLLERRKQAVFVSVRSSYVLPDTAHLPRVGAPVAHRIHPSGGGAMASGLAGIAKCTGRSRAGPTLGDMAAHPRLGHHRARRDEDDRRGPVWLRRCGFRPVMCTPHQ